MTEIPIMFFQVGATAIPTLLIAVTVGIKHGEIYATDYEHAKKKHKVYILAVLSAMALVIVLGEMSALRAIARGAGNRLEVDLVWSAIMACILLITLEMMKPMADKMSPKGGRRLLLIVTGAWVVLTAYSALVIYGVVPL
ncbi:hypothetical protein [Arthrobacter oryzae]|uniref:hypothetical protein n=1 Tax=Arthrobacter oryzae TaxID=409290 RepID=UPI002788893E|nr:hypothetical protein [Arthrobacter oryzae]MDQ0078241.1 hypothetical protein [Arthrobacter oryzae]